MCITHFILSSVFQHLGYFRFLAILSNAAIIATSKFLCWIHVLLSDWYLQVELPGYTGGCEVLSHWTLIENGNPLQFACLESLWTEEYGRLQSVGSQS